VPKVVIPFADPEQGLVQLELVEVNVVTGFVFTVIETTLEVLHPPEPIAETV
jgi:hypothetical protein